jgi:hypothetical protein
MVNEENIQTSNAISPQSDNTNSSYGYNSQQEEVDYMDDRNIIPNTDSLNENNYNGYDNVNTNINIV